MRYKHKNIISRRILILVFSLLAITFSTFTFQYYTKLKDTIENESAIYLEEISRRIEGGITQFIEDNYSVLQTFIYFLKSSEVDSFSHVNEIIESQQEYWKYQDVFLITDSRRAYNLKGEETILNNDTYFNDVVVNKKNGISTTQLINNKECIMFFMPINYEMVIDGKKIVALGASYDPASFDKTLSMSAFDEQAFSCIINKKGTVVIRTNAKGAQNLGYNILSSIGSYDLAKGFSLEKLQEDIENDVNGYIVFNNKKEKYYMVYTPIQSENWVLTTFVPSSAVNNKSDLLMKATLVLCGVITVAFSSLILFFLYTFYKHKEKLEHIAYQDDVTGGNTIQKFYELTNEVLFTSGEKEYALIYTNIEKFKVLNEQFGRNTCDEILKVLYDLLNNNLRNKECMGRLSADNFCILIEYKNEQEIIERFNKWYSDAEDYVLFNKPIWPLPVLELGIYVIDDLTLPLTQVIDRAKLAIRENTMNVNSKLHYGIYDDKIRTQLFREKHLEDRMETALNNNEFKVYLQPKYYSDSRAIGGAEALVRWISPAEGMIYPDEFIPLFEKNGFIIKLDLWVFEQVCKTLQKWIAKGVSPIKISVNCSRINLKRANFMGAYKNIAIKYNIPPELIEIEFTESIAMEDSEQLIDIIEDLHSFGFSCSMDDFGSGYSSLNLLQSIAVDTLKLDKIFFINTVKDTTRKDSIVKSVISMAKSLSMVTVAEGIEQIEQVDMLEKMGCDYIQGYVFSRPIPLSDFEEIAFGWEKNKNNKEL